VAPIGRIVLVAKVAKWLRWGTPIVLKCEMEHSHVKSLVGNRQRKRFRSQHR
jgi:hypothetical protein